MCSNGRELQMMPISRQSESHIPLPAQFSMQHGNFLRLGPQVPWSIGYCLHQVCSLKEQLSAHQRTVRTQRQGNKHICILWRQWHQPYRALSQNRCLKTHLMLTALQGSGCRADISDKQPKENVCNSLQTALLLEL